jgi:hypothetical protein
MITPQRPEGKHRAAPDRNRALLRELLERIDLGEAMRRRAVQEAMADALPEVWRRRARDFREAAPRPTDFRGRASRRDWSDQYLRCMATAKACELHAQLLEEGLPEYIAEEIADALEEVA